MLKTVLSVVLFSFLIFPQENDSLLFKNDKSLADSTIISVTDTTVSVDTTEVTQTAPKDTLVPIQGEPLTDVSSIISRGTFLFENYQYTGDLLRSFNLNFIKHLGFVGYPHETFIYGVGNSGISFLQDGLLINNRFTNSLDLNFVQSEDIDSIEIVPSPRGFLYGPYNNPVTVNFITRDFVPPVPYSRIKYYEGPDGEAMIDGQFNAMLAKRWNFSFQATNRIVDETYTNTEFSIWQVNTKLKYFLSNSVNITGSYYFVGSNQGLNGGVDYDSLTQISDNPASDLYEPFVAPVLYPNRTLDVTQHNFRLRTLAKPFEDSKLDLSVYYRYEFNEINNFQDSLNILESAEENISGGSFNYHHRFGAVSLELFSTYEQKNFYIKENNTLSGVTTSQSDYNLNRENFNVGGIFALYLLEDNLEASIFYKYNSLISGYFNSDKSGKGIDITYNLFNRLKFYLGISTYENYEYQDAGSFETGANFNIAGLFIDFKYFNTDYNLFNPKSFWGPRPLMVIPTANVKGLGFNFNYKLWVMLIESNLSYYDLNTSPNYNLPDFQFVGGLFINDFFFDNNLELKTGFKFYYTGEISISSNIQDVEPSNKLDFTLAGEIQKVAIFYFQWENLFGNQYYITPYYPMPERSIRFGLAWELFN